MGNNVGGTLYAPPADILIRVIIQVNCGRGNVGCSGVDPKTSRGGGDERKVGHADAWSHGRGGGRGWLQDHVDQLLSSRYFNQNQSRSVHNRPILFVFFN